MQLCVEENMNNRTTRVKVALGLGALALGAALALAPAFAQEPGQPPHHDVVKASHHHHRHHMRRIVREPQMPAQPAPCIHVQNTCL